MSAPLRLAWAALPGLLAIAALAVPLGAQDEAAEPNRGCWSCHGDSEDLMEFEDGTEVPIGIDKRSFLESAHGKLACVACHVGLDPMEHAFAEHGEFADYRTKLAGRCAACHSGTVTDIDPALIPQKKLEGHLHPPAGDGVPLCVDCHTPHAVGRGAVLRSQASASCANCHEDVYATFAASVHGGALTQPGNADLPACVDCHAGHEETGRTLAEQNVRLGRPCMGCHGDKGLMERYGLSTKVVSTYLNDFHGVSVRFYNESEDGAGMPTLVCADCHGVHDVAAMSAVPPEQMKTKLLSVCRDCHPDASESFPDAWLSHYEPSPKKAPLVFAIRLAYWIFIPFVIIGLSLQIFAHLVFFPRRKKLKGHVGPAHIEPGDERKLVTRFGLRHRIEHLLVMVTFVLLLATGLPQKFSSSDWAVFVTGIFGGIDTMRAIHRVVGILFSGLCALHLVVAIGAVLAGRTKMTMVPTKKDFRDAVVNLKYYMGATDEQPKFDRYEYRQKFEYWGMIVGSLVMIVSGFVLYFPMVAAQFLPGQFIPAAKAAHTYEAMMALLTIVVWHMYGAHLNPDCFPLDRSIFTGKISLARMKHEHVLEWEREKDRLEITEVGGETDTPGETVPAGTP